MGQLIDRNDLTAFRNLSVNIDDAALDPYIIEAELFDIKPFLGAALFKDFIENKAEQKYLDLLNGVDYTYDSNTITFEGLLGAIAYFAIARYLNFANTASTPYGIKIKTSEHSSEPSSVQVRAQIDQARTSANFYLNETKQFLDENYASYLLWKCAGKKRKGGAIISVVG
jgi:hypothetical protein